MEDAEGYLRKAQAASLLVSENGDDVSQYHASIHWHARESLAILGELTEGIDRGEISLHYQPKICLQTGTIAGAEALMRWHHRERGMISPGDFIPRAEQSTLIHTLTAFALDQALQQAAEWHGLGIRIPIAINVSPRNLLQPGFCEAVLAAMKRTGATTDMLELEVTENVLMTDIERVAVELQQLAGHGIKIAIDDFGAGYSSLTYLYRLPVTHLKVDKSFVQGLAEEEVSAHIVEAVVSMARKIGIKTIAEGVETEVVYERLRDLGCDVAQGFFIAKPMPAAEFERWYRNWRGRPQLTT
ncbi:putative bifunctional diguanylate cyclase/phosphodiesterase [Noviherbaspirillum sp. Root189]|uniref:putative bifunctional diguanylate cyclase/phosphodiesterase n=1 Tax=Noviherbaspirillum sp. Root189 TaxID=1736487 RepID=UPI00070921CE|nr:EAL domain-containing protein [Noviherbaspirillum sp. Root189]KRB70670.1 hypothetical protein ASE07_08750 [Noviherbaspirillum sp. Root189]